MVATFVYPPNGNFSTVSGLMVNYYDYLGVQYNTSWSGLEIVLSCWSNSTSSQWSEQESVDNPRPGIGSYYFGTIYDISMTITGFPTRCDIILYQLGGSSYLVGDQFWVSHNPTATPVTYYPAASLSSAPTTSKQTTSPVTSTAAMTTTSSSRPSAMAASTVRASSVLDSPLAVQSTTGSQDNPTSSTTGTAVPAADGARLSAGATAGIGVGAADAGLLIFAILGIFLRRYLRSRRLTGRKPQLSQIYDPPPYASEKTVS